MPQDTPNPTEPGLYWVWWSPGADPEPALFHPAAWPAPARWDLLGYGGTADSVWAWAGPLAIPPPPECPR